MSEIVNDDLLVTEEVTFVFQQTSSCVGRSFSLGEDGVCAGND